MATITITKRNSESRFQNWRKICCSLSVEPAGFLLVCSAVVSHLIFSNMIMETACKIDLQLPPDTCREIINKV
jgi:hypothetical protein